MRRFLFFIALALLSNVAASQSVFINEIHYDNTGADSGELVEVAGPPGTDLTGWSIVLYNGSGGASYSTFNLAGTLPSSCTGLGVLSTLTPGIQNGAPDGIALVNASNVVVQFLSYEGTFTATNGPANGMLSTDIGVSEPGTGPVGESLQLSGTGSDYADFTWNASAVGTSGSCNTNQLGLPPGGVFFNEIHYDNTGTDAGEFIEIAGPPGTDLTGWSVVLYNGTGGVTYNTANLAGTLPTSCPGLGVTVVNYPVNGLQNGAPDGMALVDAANNVVQFLSYEGSMLATNGPAIGLNSVDIGVLEAGADPAGLSLQLSGTGNQYADFVWNAPAAQTSGACNTNQFGLGGGSPTLSIDDVSANEGDAGTSILTFTVSLTVAAAVNVTFDVATADDSATTADNDYVARSLLTQTITAGNTTYSFDVTVNGDTTVEGDESFFVNVSNVVGAAAGDLQGVGSIVNDDFVLTPIHDIQGPGASSPLVGSNITTRGVVTGRKSNGFFMQEPDATIDADPLTSEGIFVFTSVAPPAAATVGNLVQVSATVVEFVPTSDPFQPPLTELGSATVTQVSAGNPLPAPIALTTSFPDPAGAFDQLESLEGMRVSVASLTVNAATAGNVNEPNATGSNNGVFHGVVTGVPRSLREAGIQPPDPAPAGTIPPIPRWDGNPELIRVDSDGLVGQPQLTVAVGQTVSGLIGPLDYGFRRYTLLPELGSTPVAAGSATSIAVSAPLPTEVTVASYNLQRFFDDVDDAAISEPVLTALAYANRLNKASLGIRNELQTPDIVGVVEVENLSTLQTLASKINSDAVAAAQPDPMYVAYLIEGNDVGGIDVGFLVKTAPVVAAVPRVSVNAVVQELAGSQFVNPDMSSVLLNDRPPLRLDAVVNSAGGQTYPLTVIVNHLRSLSGATDTVAGPNGWPTDGERIRAKRQAQAEDLANLVQTRQTNNPNEQIVLVGDFNAFEFNDGLGDSMNTITGTPTPDNQTAVTGDGADLVNPDLDNLFDTAAVDERYSFVFDGVAQSLDHALVNSAVLLGTAAPRIEHARINAGFPEVDRNDPATARRLSDHDPLVVYLTPNGFIPIDISIDKVVNGDPVVAGTQIDYTIDVSNAGPQPALNSVWTDTLGAGTRFVSLSSVAGWSCTTPAVGATGNISCSNPSVAIGSSVFTLVVSVDANVPAGTVISNTAAVTTGSPDLNPMNNSSIAQFNVIVSSDLLITLSDAPDPVTAGTNLTYTATVTNAGPSDAAGVAINLPLPAGTSFSSGSVSGGGSCLDAGGVVCTVSGSIAPGGSRTATIVVAVAPAVLSGTLLNATATVSSGSPDPNSGNNSAATTTTVATSADLLLSFSASALQVLVNEPVTFTATSLNQGPSDAQDVVIAITLTPDFRYSSHTPSAGASCTTPQVGNVGVVSCTWSGATAPGATRSLQVVAFSNSEGASAVNASTSSNTPDPVANNNLGNVSVQVGFLVNEIPTLSGYGLILLGLMLGLFGVVVVRRER
jgi:uncharacterized protein